MRALPGYEHVSHEVLVSWKHDASLCALQLLCLHCRDLAHLMRHGGQRRTGCAIEDPLHRNGSSDDAVQKSSRQAGMAPLLAIPWARTRRLSPVHGPSKLNMVTASRFRLLCASQPIASPTQGRVFDKSAITRLALMPVVRRTNDFAVMEAWRGFIDMPVKG